MDRKNGSISSERWLSKCGLVALYCQIIHNFEGPYDSIGSLEDNSGVYAILCKESDKYYVKDIGESANVKTRIENHDRADCWKKNCTGKLYVAVLYTPNKQSAGRMLIEQELRAEYDPVCGKQ